MGIPRAWPWWLLIGLTFFTLLTWSPQGPFDARTLTVPAGVHLDYPWSGVAMEPLLAPAHIIMGAPDFRLALLSFALWGGAIAFLAGAWPAAKGRRLREGGRRALGFLGLFVLYTLFMALVHLPGWRLIVDDSNLVVADLQSHTAGSHDGLVTAEESLLWHKARGYHVTAVTEHKRPEGSFAAQALAAQRPDLPGVIPGVEVRAEEEEFLLGLGIRPDRPVLPFGGNEKNFAERFIADVHRQGGAVVALSWLLEPRHVEKLARVGVDGIELANTGHPDVSPPLRASMLETSKRGVLMIASTDWHGWGGFTRTWTLVRVPGAALMDNQAKARAVVDVLRSRDGEAVMPVIAGEIGTPPPWRWIAAPVVETVRYLAEMSPGRVGAWWVWTLVFLGAARFLRGHGLRPLWVGLAVLCAVVGGALAWRAKALLALTYDGALHEYAVGIGIPALVAGLAGLLAAAWLVRAEVRARAGATR